MKRIQVYDKPMCCSTGVCGPQVDPVLPRFAADLDWLKAQGHRVERYNLAQQPQAFIQNASVHRLLSTEGTDCLPLIVIDGQIVNRAKYPSRAMLSRWTESPAPTPAAAGCCGSAPKDSARACCAEDEHANATGKAGCGCKDSVC